MEDPQQPTANSQNVNDKQIELNEFGNNVYLNIICYYTLCLRLD